MTTDPVLTRLRHANPFPESKAVDDAESLFAQITAVPADTAAGREAASRRRRALVLALSLAVVALLASTAFAVSSWVVGEAVEPPVTRSEYRRAQEVLRLPPGDAWPDASVEAGTVTSRGAGGGRAVLIALNAWECYWVDAIRVRDADAQRRARAALGALLQRHVVEAPSGAPEGWAPPDASTRPVAVFAADGGLAWIREGYALAAAGDPRRIAASCRANAPG